MIRIFALYCCLALAASPLLLAQQAPQEQTKKTDAPGEKSGSQPGAAASSASSNASAGGEISGAQLAGLPLNGRSYSQLATLQAGISDPSAEQSSRGGGGGSLTVAGGRSQSNNFLLDGTNIMDTDNRVPRSAAGVQLGTDSVFQVQVYAANVQAEYGRGSGGVLNSISRSGSEAFHGSFFEYFRNSKLDARNFFDPEAPPPFKRNQFGFTVSGPIRKSGTFIMGSYEGLLDRLAETSVDFFPDAESRRGLITDANGNVTQTVNVAPSIVPILGLYPIPNGTRQGRGVGENRSPQFSSSDEHFFSVRLDSALTDKDSVFGRYTFDNSSSIIPQASFLFSGKNKSRQQYATLAYSRILGPDSLLTARFGYTRPVRDSVTLSKIDFPKSTYFVPGAPQFGQIFHPGLTPFGPSQTTPEGATMNSFQYSADLLARKGKHGLKIGFDIQSYRWFVFSHFAQSGIWRFNSLENYLTAGAGGGVNVTVALPGSDDSKNFRQTLLGFYLHDSYAVSPRLRVTVGLRYEFATTIHDKDGRTSYLASPLTDQEAKIGPLFANNPSVPSFSPRVGIAWSPFGPRGLQVATGFGMYYDQAIEYLVDSRRDSVPFQKLALRTNADTSATFPNAVASLGNPIPFLAQVSDYRHTTTPTVLRYNFSLQKQLAGNLRLQAAYVGARSNHLFRSYEINLYPIPVRQSDGSLFFPRSSDPLNPAFRGGINLLSSDAQAFYNALQLTAGKSFGKGLSIQANYTWSKSVDDASGIGIPSGSPPSSAPPYLLDRKLDRGLSDFDIRHRISTSYFFTIPESGKSRGAARILAEAARAWRLGGIVSVRSGIPTTPQINVAVPGYIFAAWRPNLNPGKSNNPVKGISAGCDRVAPGEKLGTADRYYDPCAFGLPAPGTLGNLGRNTVIARKVFNMDLSLQREFALHSKSRLQFRADIFNLTNHASLNRPVTGALNVYSGFPGRINPTAGVVQSTVNTSRQIQFALRLSF